MNQKIFIILFLLFSNSLLAESGMVKVVFRCVMPDLPSDSFTAKPKVLYCWGDTKSRLEEASDPLMKLHLLMINNEKDNWMINLWDKTGKHRIETGPNYHTYFPIAPLDGLDAQSLKEFQIGKELSFMKSRKVAPKNYKENGKDFLLYEHEEAGLVLKVYVSKETSLPAKVSALKENLILSELYYDQYVVSMPPDENLFKPPKGIRFLEEN